MDPFTLLWVAGYVALMLAVLFKFFTWNFDYFIEQGIPGPAPIPIFGNCWKIWDKPWNQVEIQRYRKYGRIYGTFEGRTPNFVIGDPKLIGRILVDDFKHFENRRRSSSKSKYLKYTLSSMRGRPWSSVRKCVSSAFATEAVDAMTPLIEESGKELISFLNHKLTTGIKKIDCQKAATSFAIDVVARIVFERTIDAITNPDSDFVQEVTAMFSAEPSSHPHFILSQIYPRLGKMISSPDGFEYFANFAKSVLKNRRAEDPKMRKRGDFVDYLIGHDSELDDNHIVAQMLECLVGGVEPVATTVACAINSLTLNPGVQDKLRDEIRGVLKEGNFIGLANLPYLDQCISETLRLFPPAVRLERQCNRSINYETAKIRKGILVSIPIYAIHHDPEIYPQPDLFDPDRFSPDEKRKREPYTFLPFGNGGRSCLASAFALQQVKMAVVQLLTEFRFIRVFETSDPPHFKASGLPPILQPKTVIVGIEKCSP